jgi:hypothetical protein
MNKREFDTLLQKFENGDCTPEEILFLEGVVDDSINNNFINQVRLYRKPSSAKNIFNM